MAGHSKFKNIQFRKDRQDKVRSKVFSKLSRDITLAARSGLPDPTSNARLRLAIANARAESMPKENIDRAIRKASGGEADAMEDIRYEGFGPGGVGVIVEALTDNRNRVAANIRSIFGKFGGNLGESGSVAFMFERLGRIVYPSLSGSEEAVIEAAIAVGALDVEVNSECRLIFTAVESLTEIAEALESVLGAPTSSGVVWRPKIASPLGAEERAALFRLIDALEEEEDVQDVWTALEVAPALEEQATV
ncbi:MAG: YebC/PmpR family DNA-binding transcriptional regulator [Caulobacteraceae bacterium]